MATNDIYLDGKRLPGLGKELAQGGEAYVYVLGDGRVLKVYKRPDDPTFLDADPETERRNREGARARLAEHQRKLPAFPKNVPAKLVAPTSLAKDGKGQIVGYAMPFLKGATALADLTEQGARATTSSEDARRLLLDLHGTVEATHRAGIVIGDFNDLNVLVANGACYLIDADSMQFGPYLCGVFTQQFVDPTLCDPRANVPLLISRHTANSDWYAFAVMAMRCLLFADPYGGTYRQPPGKKPVPPDRRPLLRLTVFRPDVIYPRTAVPYGRLPDELLQFFHDTFEKDKRGTFPAKLLETMRWTKCNGCGTEHARPTCPQCATASPVAVKQTTMVRGKLVATRIFQTTGAILHAQVLDGKPAWIFHEREGFYRETRAKIVSGTPNPLVRWRLQPDATLIGRDERMIRIGHDGTQTPRDVDNANQRPVFDTNARHAYWTHNDALYRDDATFGEEPIGAVISGHTHIFAGPAFGFGLTRAGTMNVAFVFDAERRGINDTVKLPPIPGKLVDAHAVFSRERCWFFTAAQEHGERIHRCAVIAADGTVLGTAKAKATDDHWLNRTRGGAAHDGFLLMPSETGVIRVDTAPDGTIDVTKHYPDTENFVDGGTRLLFCDDALYAVGPGEVWKLELK